MAMSTEQAIINLMHEARKEKAPSQAAINRCIHACGVLGLSQAATIGVLGWLDICDTDGTPWKEGVTVKIGRTFIKTKPLPDKNLIERS